jgi:hypothetical protein
MSRDEICDIYVKNTTELSVYLGLNRVGLFTGRAVASGLHVLLE